MELRVASAKLVFKVENPYPSPNNAPIISESYAPRFTRRPLPVAHWALSVLRYVPRAIYFVLGVSALCVVSWT